MLLAVVALLGALTGFAFGLIAGIHWKGQVDDERLSGFLTELEATADRVANQACEDAIERAGRQ